MSEILRTPSSVRAISIDLSSVRPAKATNRRPVFALLFGSRPGSGVVGRQVALLVLVCGLCEYLVRQEIVSSLYLAAPSQVVVEFLTLASGPALLRSVYVTLSEFLVGYLLSVAAGIGVGLFLVLASGAEQFFKPVLAMLMGIPKVTIIPLLTLWLGIGMSQKIVIVFAFGFFPIVYNTIAGIKQTSENHLKVARAFQATRAQLIAKVILPSAMPTIFAGLRVAAATALVGALFGEMLASKEGLGTMLVKATALYDTAQAFALIAIVTALSVLLILLIDVIERTLFLRWRYA